jgi:energy-coupling factor transport system substrate-specific component
MTARPATSTNQGRSRRWANAVLEAVALLAPLAAMVACVASGIEQTALLTLAVAVGAVLLFFVCYDRRRPRLRDTMPVAVLAALAAAGRILFAPFPDVKPVSAIAIIAGVAFGRHSGFMVGALAALVSNFFFGQGAWTPWQMYAWGLVGYLAGVLAKTPVFKKRPHKEASAGTWSVQASDGASDTVRDVEASAAVVRDAEACAAVEVSADTEAGAQTRAEGAAETSVDAIAEAPATPASDDRMVAIYVYGFLSALLYGLILNLWSIFGFFHPQTFAEAIVLFAAAVPLDVTHGIATVAFLAVLYAPWRRKIARIKRRYGIEG